MAIQAVDVRSKNGMVTSTQDLASRAGREILLAGGNAVDAAVATALALCVVQPSSNGIAGYGGCMVIYLAGENRVVALDYNCRAPRAAREDMYEIGGGPGTEGWGEFPSVVNKANNFGPMAVSVPATIAGLSLAEKRYGKLGWAKVVEPARRLAADGYTVYEGLPENIARFTETTDPVSGQALFPDGKIPQVGETWVQADLGRLIGVLAQDPDSFYTGEIARRIADRVQSAGGILTEQDMADYRCEVTEPMTLDYRGIRLNAPPGVTGSPCTLETLAIMQKLSAEPRESEDPKFWGDLADALTLAWRDRIAFHGDVPGIEGKFSDLMSHEHASAMAEIIRSGKVRTGAGGLDPSKETIHLCTCDADRNMVTLTQTHGGGWGTRFGIPGLGVVIGHGMSRFDPRPGLPNSPGSYKQPLNNMSPVILTVGGRLWGCVGLPGGRMIPAAVTSFITGLVDFGMTPGESLSAPRIHTEAGPIAYSDNLPPGALDEIKARGHELRDEPRAIGGNASIIVLDGDGLIGAALAGPHASLGV